MIISCWNVRGLGCGGKVSMVRKLIKEKRVSFFWVVETKKASLDRDQVASLWGGGTFKWEC